MKLPFQYCSDISFKQHLLGNQHFPQKKTKRSLQASGLEPRGKKNNGFGVHFFCGGKKKQGLR